MLLHEKPLMTLREVAKKLPAARGKGHVNYCTIWRWALHGIARENQRLKLETVLIGGTRFTSWPAVERFIAALSRSTAPLHVASPTQRQKRATAAEKKLAELGL